MLTNERKIREVELALDGIKIRKCIENSCYLLGSHGESMCTSRAGIIFSLQGAHPLYGNGYYLEPCENHLDYYMNSKNWRLYDRDKHHMEAGD